MEPVTVAGHVMLGELHNELEMVGPHGGPGGPVQLYLRNGYGIFLRPTWYEGDPLPVVAPIKKDDSAIGWNYAWDAHPLFFGQCSERGCDVDRAREILVHLKEHTA
jgi:hypothetical protein